MYSRGHAGLTLLLVSLLVLPFGENRNAVIVIAFSAALSALPDIDMEWRKKVDFIHHRGVTHSIIFAIVSGLFFGGLFYYSQKTFLWFSLGFLGAFLGVVSHIIGDFLTYEKFEFLWPFSPRTFQLGLCRSSDKRVNDGLFSVGSVAVILYVLYTFGALNSFLA